MTPGLYFERKSTPYTQTILRTWGAYSRQSMPIYAVVIAQMASINTPTIRRLFRWTVPAFWSCADLETWMLDCHWLIARYLCVYAGVYAAYKINPSPWNGTQTAFAYVCVDTRGDLRRSINPHYAPRICLNSFTQKGLRTTAYEVYTRLYPASLGPLPQGGYKKVSVFSAVHDISRTFEMLTPITSTPPHPTSTGV